MGKPWILPSVLFRTFLVVLVAIGVSWLEFYFNVAYSVIQGVQVILWTIFGFSLIWLLSIIGLLLLRTTYTYILRDDSLEIRVGVLTARTSVIASSGFSDLEIIRTIPGRILNSGDIVVRTQSEGDWEKRMVKIRNPLKVGDEIRKVLTKPTFRVEDKHETKEN
jgi:uncharacterized membrane protein YdbT with pleckstrin-like domain